MFGDIAITLLKLMGHSGTVPGALLAEEVPPALDRLRKAVAVQPAAVPKAADGDEEDENEPLVALGHRALPLIELLASAATANCDVMWE